MNELDTADAPAWKPVARRGEFALIVCTLAFARRTPLVLHPDTAVLSFIIPDGGKTLFPLSHLTVEAARDFIAYMRPHSIQVQGAEGESVSALRAALDLRGVGSAGLRAIEVCDALLSRVIKTGPAA